jgi:hypothetical protein
VTEVLIHDIIEAPNFCGPIAIRQESNSLIILCPWCGEQVGEFGFNEKTFGDLVTKAQPLMYIHLVESESCSQYKASVRLKLLGRPTVLPVLRKRWNSLGIQI